MEMHVIVYVYTKCSPAAPAGLPSLWKDIPIRYCKYVVLYGRDHKRFGLSFTEVAPPLTCFLLHDSLAALFRHN